LLHELNSNNESDIILLRFLRILTLKHPDGSVMKSKVALTKGGTREQNIDESLRLIEGDINLRPKSRVFIKVNFVSTKNQLAATHVDAVRALLKFLRERYDGKITIGESTYAPARQGYVRFGYLYVTS
jgi:uncharacterized protein (DUF362 family)